MLKNYSLLAGNTPTPILIVLSLLALLPINAVAEPPSTTINLIEQGQRIYQEGTLISGKPLEGFRNGNATLKGTEAACVNCHRPSGMGSVEGDILIAPIAGNYLFNPDKVQVTNMDPRSGKKFNQAHPAYTEDSLATAITAGINNSGRNMLALMPHYALEKQDMAALSAYLHQLSSTWSAGVDAETIHLATVITPDVEPQRRKAFLDTLRLSIIQKNGSTATASSKKGRHHMTSAAEMVLGTERKWALHVWELQGTPDTWTTQLNEKLHNQPVFALLSGVTNTTWEPVHNFCEDKHIPCWFPSVALPVTTQSFYSLYFSRGVLLEADALANQLTGTNKPKRVVQISRADVVSTQAAKYLDESLTKAGIATEQRIIKAGAAISAQSLGKLTAEDTLVFWLHGNEWQQLGKALPPTVKAVYFSEALAGGQSLPETWRKVAHLVYPYQLPDKRQSNLTNFYAWHKMKKLPIVDEHLQAEAFFAVEFLTETLSEMLDNVYRDYLLERAENMLSRSESVKSEQQVRERQMRGKIGTAIQQHSTSIYPHLGLGVNQRFASKGAYITHYDKDNKLVADSDWIVP
ncbi:c-type cytochrome [Crenothrix sp.]|uniref:c-type cytochrome n=1 Tax=Crenothrix sp. TaxID=3100433 RepID=UPI00374D4CD3